MTFIEYWTTRDPLGQKSLNFELLEEDFFFYIYCKRIG